MFSRQEPNTFNETGDVSSYELVEFIGHSMFWFHDSTGDVKALDFTAILCRLSLTIVGYLTRKPSVCIRPKMCFRDR